ncbi:bifunctional 2',3'-cyclic-nucleotide 2'-phosphodiesterase/3'-nucleotidase [Domibacillus sp. DTU_2020_1001157_1_SI_ALB_TIR_016]|uniref:bifunctional 2',3'-cyclic-nucleotide 2'-phosphodiesterase/3'-nucleotidase n=1 Tax=Domibacillus sp. DTU_2020_1001157_1_SI_ALB_TIR_016 TaxID=3077789 RepID=UPI0028EDB3AA|nr:bifunctional 2',3'-cyclic-nucleotide 2'-phosphodiesterase/3'-nucleotidase [Domibacillus sp. DTU_2020_1001157_1_SI_ALB_TIR_016]WNS79966.1 bifunctional 2',3'-cyclic-nucleotide 2'-phosphodiesterase/3'-nucleotidase [Domibacillus sp. DTU_2020_1001157_1_SI_ALB_TIR_016]
MKKAWTVGTVIAAGLFVPQMAQAAEDTVKLRIVETSDLHSNVMNYDYYKDSATNAYGLAKAAALIKQVRGEADNSMLFDNGDLIQGSPLGDYVYNNGLMKEGYIHPVYKAMNQLGYDAATIGNHEFNYGLEYMDTALNGAAFPYVNANVYDTEGNPYFTPFKIIEKEVKDTDGEVHTIKVGVTGFVPQDIMKWDAKHLEGKLVVEDIVNSAQKVVPQMKEAGADVIVVLSHSGIAEYDQNGAMKEYTEGIENASYYLTKIPGVDAVLTGHQHLSFPNAAKPSFPDGNGIDNTNGTINGVPMVMPGSWGNNIGLIDLQVQKVNGKWDVTSGTGSLKPITSGNVTVEADAAVAASVQTEHEATIKYMETPVGELKGDLNTYFGLVRDNAAMEILNRAQTWYVEDTLKGTQYENLPVLSAAAPFKAGRGGVEDYTDVQAGTLVLKNIADLYLYDNNVVNAVKVNGATLKEWLEWSAGQFNTIDPAKEDGQALINPDFPTYNFDVIDGVTYEIDVTSLPKYDKGQNVINASANRIKNLKFNGKPVTDGMEFIVATNDYRAAGSKLMNPGGVNTVLKAPDSNRQAVMNYVKEFKEIDAAVDNNWTFAKTKAKATFTSNPKAEALAKETDNITYTGKTDEKGFGIFELDLNKGTAGAPSFADVPADHWAAEYIAALAEAGIIKGKTDATFDPEGDVTRGQFASMLVRTMKWTAQKETPFVDVKGRLKQDITAAFEAGVVKGTTAKTFEPAKSISRAEMAAMLVRAYEKKHGAVKVTGSMPFTDVGQYRTSIQQSIQKAYQLGLMEGTGKIFKPGDTATRAEAAKVLYLLGQK